MDVGDKKEYLIPRGKHINVYEGDYIRAGEPLIGGADLGVETGQTEGGRGRVAIAERLQINDARGSGEGGGGRGAIADLRATV